MNKTDIIEVQDETLNYLAESEKHRDETEWIETYIQEYLNSGFDHLSASKACKEWLMRGCTIGISNADLQKRGERFFKTKRCQEEYVNVYNGESAAANCVDQIMKFVYSDSEMTPLKMAAIDKVLTSTGVQKTALKRVAVAKINTQRIEMSDAAKETLKSHLLKELSNGEDSD